MEGGRSGDDDPDDGSGDRRNEEVAADPSPANHGAAGSLAPAAAIARSPTMAAFGGRKRVGLGLGRSWTRRAL